MRSVAKVPMASVMLCTETMLKPYSDVAASADMDARISDAV